jgi:hypothetical protein
LHLPPFRHFFNRQTVASERLAECSNRLARQPSKPTKHKHSLQTIYTLACEFDETNSRLDTEEARQLSTSCTAPLAFGLSLYFARSVSLSVPLSVLLALCLSVRSISLSWISQLMHCLSLTGALSDDLCLSSDLCLSGALSF